MKPNQLQYKIADFIIDQSTQWKFSKDINHPYHVTLLEKSVSNLHLSTEESLELEGIMKGLYYFIKRHGEQ
jgi:hypothetical protein